MPYLCTSVAYFAARGWASDRDFSGGLSPFRSRPPPAAPKSAHYSHTGTPDFGLAHAHVGGRTLSRLLPCVKLGTRNVTAALWCKVFLCYAPASAALASTARAIGFL